jgi:impB/mucB/samB family
VQQHRVRNGGLVPAGVTVCTHQVEHAQIFEAEGVTRRHGTGLFIPTGYRLEQKMNTSTADNAVQWLFLDLNAFFASCEQQENPALRGKPVIVVQTPTDSACAIAASYAAKAFGIKTGTLVKEARRLCPDVIPVQANHRLYTDYHDRILTAVDTCLPVEKVCSIDEMACLLMGTERQVPVARQLALKVKRALRDQVGESLTCSIGIAPNVFLGKVGSDLLKPDGLVVIAFRENRFRPTSRRDRRPRTDARLTGGNSSCRGAAARPPWSAGAAQNHARPLWCAGRAGGRCFWKSATWAAGYRRRAASGGRAAR